MGRFSKKALALLIIFVISLASLSASSDWKREQSDLIEFMVSMSEDIISLDGSNHGGRGSSSSPSRENGAALSSSETSTGDSASSETSSPQKPSDVIISIPSSSRVSRTPSRDQESLTEGDRSNLSIPGEQESPKSTNKSNTILENVLGMGPTLAPGLNIEDSNNGGTLLVDSPRESEATHENEIPTDGVSPSDASETPSSSSVTIENIKTSLPMEGETQEGKIREAKCRASNNISLGFSPYSLSYTLFPSIKEFMGNERSLYGFGLTLGYEYDITRNFAISLKGAFNWFTLTPDAAAGINAERLLSSSLLITLIGKGDIGFFGGIGLGGGILKYDISKLEWAVAAEAELGWLFMMGDSAGIKLSSELTLYAPISSFTDGGNGLLLEWNALNIALNFRF